MLTTVGLVVLAIVLGAILGLLTAWPAWTREARQRYIESMVSRGEIERQANRIAFLEGRVRERDSEIKQLESDLGAKDLLNEGLKIGMAQLRDRLSDQERHGSETSVGLGQQNGDGATEQLRERIAALEPLSVQLAARDRQIRHLEAVAGELEEWRSKLQLVQAEHREEVVAKEAEVSELRRRVAELEPLVEQLPQRDKAMEEVARLKAEVESREHRMRRLQEKQEKTLQRKDDKIDQLRKRIATIEPLVAGLAERETRVGELQATVRELKDEQRRFDEEHRLAIETREAQIEGLRDEVSQLAHLQDQLAARDARIAEIEFLEMQMSELEGLEARLREREARLNELERQHSLAADDKDTEIARLRDRIGELAPLAERLERRRERIAELEESLEAERAQHARVQKELEARHQNASDTRQPEHSVQGTEVGESAGGSPRALRQREKEVETVRRRLRAIEERCAETVREKDDTLITLQQRVAELEEIRQQLEESRGEQCDTLEKQDRELERLRKRIGHLQPRARRARSGGGRATPVSPKSPARKDNLKRIRGIGPALERKLNELGCYSFHDIVGWEAAEIERVARALRASPKRIKNEWVRQARSYVRRDGAVRVAGPA